MVMITGVNNPLVASPFGKGGDLDIELQSFRKNSPFPDSDIRLQTVPAREYYDGATSYLIVESELKLPPAIQRQDTTNLGVKSGKLYRKLERVDPWSNALPLNYFGADEDYARAKREMIRTIGIGVYNSDVQRIANEAQTVLNVPAAFTIDDIAGISNRLTELGYDKMPWRMLTSATNLTRATQNAIGAKPYSDPAILKAWKKNELDESLVGMFWDSNNFLPTMPGEGTATSVTGRTIDLTTAANNFHIPKSSDLWVSSDAEDSQAVYKDSSYQVINISSTTGIVPGMAFTVFGMTSMNRANPMATSNVSPVFRVKKVKSSTQLVITPGMCYAPDRAGGISDLERAYKNCHVATPTSSHAITFLNNTVTTQRVSLLYPARTLVRVLPDRFVPSQKQEMAEFNTQAIKTSSLEFTKGVPLYLYGSGNYDTKTGRSVGQADPGYLLAQIPELIVAIRWV